MAVSPERLTELFNRYLDSNCTEAEKLELSELSLLEENQHLVSGLLSAAWDNGAVDYPVPASDQSAAILEKILLSAPQKKSRVIPLWVRRMSAAAVITGALIFSYYIFFIPKKPQTEPQNLVQKMDLAPGGNRATLTLSNGAKIILDSAQTGLLAQQGLTKIIKTDSGKLSYTAIDQPSTSNRQPLSRDMRESTNTLTTPRGGQYQLVLPDGTKVWLNAASSITYPSAFTGDTRLVMITGEVYFEVVHNAKQPFSVKVDDRLITDIGTSFNINAYPEEGAITTTVITGSARMFVGTKSNLLNAGQQELASFEGESILIKNHVDIARIIAWQRGQFEFNETKLPVIMRQISRWYDVDIKYEGAITTEDFGGGISRNLPLSDVQKLLEANGVLFRLEGKTLFVSYHPVK